jgi:heme/copper-type cytochrome/quinol oxidase subunit 2
MLAIPMEEWVRAQDPSFFTVFGAFILLAIVVSTVQLIRRGTNQAKGPFHEATPRSILWVLAWVMIVLGFFLSSAMLFRSVLLVALGFDAVLLLFGVSFVIGLFYGGFADRRPDD